MAKRSWLVWVSMGLGCAGAGVTNAQGVGGCELRVRPHVVWPGGVDRLQGAVLGDMGNGARLHAVGRMYAAGEWPDPFTGELRPTYGEMFASLHPGRVWKMGPRNVPLAWSSNPQALAIFDDGTGPALFVGAEDSYWWTSPPRPMRVLTRVQGEIATEIGPFDARTSFSTGSARVGALKPAMLDGVPVLLIGGVFAGAQGVVSRSIIAWDGARFLPIGESVLGAGALGNVQAIEVFDSGRGPEMHIAGELYESQPALVSLSAMARLRDGAWEPIGPRELLGEEIFYDHIRALRTFDDGRGERLWAAGNFLRLHNPDFSRTIAATWDGDSWWFAPNLQDSGEAKVMEVTDVGEGARLFVGGGFYAYPYPTSRALVEWTGESWREVGGGLGTPETSANVRALTSGEVDGEPVLLAAGEFTVAGGRPAAHLASWNGREWKGLEPQHGPDSTVEAGVVSSVDGAPVLYVAGAFRNIGEMPADFLARWNGEAWSAVPGAPSGGISAMVEYDADGAGPSPTKLVVGGQFQGPVFAWARNVATWDGANWLHVGEGLNGQVHRLRVIDPDGPFGPLPESLVASGAFTASGSRPMSRIARWNGGAWESLGPVLNNPVYDFCMVDLDGAGPAPERLVVGGQFTYVNGEPAQGGGDVVRGVAQLVDGRWEPVGEGLFTTVRALEVFDADGPGPQPASLLAGGSLVIGGSGSSAVSSVVRWTGASWEPSSTASGETRAFQVFDEDGGGLVAPALYGVGSGPTGIRRLRGGVWSDVAFASHGQVRALVRVPREIGSSAPRLLGLGQRMLFDGIPAYVAELIGCDGGCAGDVNGDGRVDMIDLVGVLSEFGEPSPPSAPRSGDVNGDGVVDFLDLNIVLSAFGTAC